MLRLSVEQLEDSLPRDDEVAVRILDARMIAARGELADELERRIAWFLMLFGEWPSEHTLIRGTDGAAEAIEIAIAPPAEARELVADQGFAGIGALSSMYSSLYNYATLSTDLEVRELRHEPTPGELAALIPADYWDSADRNLPLWVFEMRPEGED
jgi:hypothetical protein